MSTRDIHTLTAGDRYAEGVMRAVYERSLFHAHERPSYRRDGRAARWALDVRHALAQGNLLADVSRLVARMIEPLGVSQVVGYGVGSSFLVGGVLAQTSWSGGIIREARKTYGFRERIEGALVKDRPLVIVDDILSSGYTFARSISLLRECGYAPVAAIPLFCFGWRDGMARMAEMGIHTLPIATLQYLRPQTTLPLVRWEITRQRNVTWELGPCTQNQ